MHVRYKSEIVNSGLAENTEVNPYNKTAPHLKAEELRRDQRGQNDGNSCSKGLQQVVGVLDDDGNEQPPQPLAHPFGELFGGLAHQARQGDDRGGDWGGGGWSGGGLPRGAFTELVAPGEGSGSATPAQKLCDEIAAAGGGMMMAAAQAAGPAAQPIASRTRSGWMFTGRPPRSRCRWRSRNPWSSRRTRDSPAGCPPRCAGAPPSRPPAPR